MHDSINKIVKHPNIFPQSYKKSGIRKCVVNRHVSLFYSIENNQIIIKSVFDNRQNPNKLKV